MKGTPFWYPSYWKTRKMKTLTIEGISVYMGDWMIGHGMALPPLGILIGPDYNQELIRHEFGHILQYQKKGFLGFYFSVGIPSFVNMILLGIEKGITGTNKIIPRHSEIRAEKEANEMVREYFKSQF